MNDKPLPTAAVLALLDDLKKNKRIVFEATPPVELRYPGLFFTDMTFKTANGEEHFAGKWVVHQIARRSRPAVVYVRKIDD